MANGLPDFRIQQQFPIASVIEAIQRKPVLEEQIRGSQQQRQLAPLQFALEAAQAGSNLATQSLIRAETKESLKQRIERRQVIQELANLSTQVQGPTIPTAPFGQGPGQLQVQRGTPVSGFAQPQITQQQFQQRARPLATQLAPGAAAQQLLQPPTPTIGPEVSAQAKRAGIQISPGQTQAQFEAARQARALEIQAQPTPKASSAELLKQEVELKSTLADIGTIEEELNALPAGLIKGGTQSLAASFTGGFSNPQVKAYNDNLNQRAVRFYRATTKDTRLSDFDARKSALPMMPKLTDTRATQTLKTQALRLTAEENLNLVTQAQAKFKDSKAVIAVQNIARNRLRQRGQLIERIAKFNAKNPNNTVPLTMDSILQLEKSMGLR